MKTSIWTLMVMSLFSNILHADTLEIGSSAPQVSTVDHEGNNIDLGSELDQGITVVFFYPKAMTPGCTAQACSLRDAWDELQEYNVKVFGVSSDTAKTQMAFRDKYELPFTLIADTDKVVSKAFGKSRWSRHAYIFKDGVLIWKDTSASTAKQAEDILKVLKNLE
jgi:thioredoxin-dependent peroxiredoxin